MLEAEEVLAPQPSSFPAVVVNLLLGAGEPEVNIDSPLG